MPGAFRQLFIYNNLMYGALGHVFGELIGTPYERFVRDRILRPLEMNATSFSISDDDADVAFPYVGTARVRGVDMSCVAAAGGLKSTLHDLTSWIRHQLASGAMAAPTHNPQVPVDGVNPILLKGLDWLADRLQYGFGWFVGTMQGMRVVFHPAVIDGFSLAIALIPERALGVVVMMNVNLSAVPGLLVQHLLMRMLHPPPAAALAAQPVSERDRRSTAEDRSVSGSASRP